MIAAKVGDGASRISRIPRHTLSGDRVFSYIVLSVFTVLTLFPIFIMIAVSLMPSRHLSSDLYHLWPTNIDLRNYLLMWSQLPVAHLLLNSVIIAGGSTILALLTGIPAAFALSRMNIVGRKIWLFGFLATQLFSPSIIIVSAYHVMAIAHLTDTYWGLIILDAGFYSLPFVLWSIAGFMRHIPRELEETVDVDGGSTWTKIWRVFVPIAIPSIVVAGVYAFIQSWNDFAFALTLATSQSTMPLPIGIYSFMGAYQIQWNYLMGASLVATLPVLILFLIVQKRLVSGMLAGSIK
ncbi:MAG: hypothetical protein C7B43_15075 [Sulfobacillus benefaciens]|uniref:ABC transmembrane type-1 domain-containing protein n=1 Tax=Sulfobacillus benefaciens TaxID=453960 RepID=A0A2T2WV02_9FIRM|nr:MAG: hypothetical protein C7B43_15075 [Sulfobacillus benefaciens]